MKSLTGERIAVYARYSSDLQSVSSIEDQFLLVRKFIEANGGRWDDTVTFEDAAVSGASVRRPGFQALRSAVVCKNPKFDVIVVESVDRISRDMGDAVVLFQELAFASVRLITVSDGVDTKNPSARLNYGLRAVIADQYLADLGEKTRRGLQGRAANGFSTGGLPFGYRSIRHTDSRGNAMGSEIAIDDGEAKVVQRIFEMWLAGASCLRIASQLNSEGIATPRGALKRNGRGWVDTTIRAILRNTAYIGQWSYCQKRWVKEPTTKRRRYRRVPDEQVQRFERAHLRIIEQVVWAESQRRIKATEGRGKGRKKGCAPIRKTRYPLSGLLYCACGAPMVIIGGSSARYYKCGDYHKRGTCKLNRPLREAEVSAAILAGIRRQLENPQSIAYLAEMLRRKALATQKDAGADIRAAEQELRAVEQKIANLVDSIASGVLGELGLAPVRQRLEVEEASRRTLEAKLLALEQTVQTGQAVPDAAELTRRAEASIANLDQLVKKDPVRAREQIRRFIPGGRIQMTPNDDGSWTATFRLYPPVSVPGGKNSNGPGSDSGAVYSSSCAGSLVRLYHSVKVPISVELVG